MDEDVLPASSSGESGANLDQDGMTSGVIYYDAKGVERF